MPVREIKLSPVDISQQILHKLDEMGLIMTFKPTRFTLNPPSGENIGETLYVSEEKYGPHKLIAVGVNKTHVRLGVHGDNEEFLIPDHGPDVKPVFLVISHLKKEDLVAKDIEGKLSDDDFTCLSLYPAPRGAEMFTMLKGTVHCEVTNSGEGKFGCFYVTESNNLNVEWVDLRATEIVVDG